MLGVQIPQRVSVDFLVADTDTHNALPHPPTIDLFHLAHSDFISHHLPATQVLPFLTHQPLSHPRAFALVDPSAWHILTPALLLTSPLLHLDLYSHFYSERS